MVLKGRPKLLDKKLDFAKNRTVSILLPQDNPLRRVTLHASIKTDAGATPAVGIKNGNILNLIERIRVVANGSDVIFDCDLRTYFAALTYEYGAKPYLDTFTIPAANASGTDEIDIPIDFALIRNQLSDYSALVPAQLLDSLQLSVTFGDIGDIVTTANTATVSKDTTIEVSIYEIYETTGDLSALNDVLGRITRVYEGTEETVITKAYNSYPNSELAIPVSPVPATHLVTLLIARSNITDLDPSDSNSVIDYVKIENVRGGGEAIFIERFKYLNFAQKLEYALESSNTVGQAYLDWTDIRNGGLQNISLDAIQIKLLTAAPTATKENALRIYKKYIPVAV